MPSWCDALYFTPQEIPLMDKPRKHSNSNCIVCQQVKTTENCGVTRRGAFRSYCKKCESKKNMEMSKKAREK